MKRILPLLVATASVFMVQPLIANEQFNQGMQQGKANKGQGADAIQGFKPAEVIPGYTTSPSESGYYGGVTSSVRASSGWSAHRPRWSPQAPSATSPARWP